MYYSWPVESPKALLIFIHGLKSHAGWFLDSGQALAERGIKVYAFDRRGSGRSEEPPGDIPSYKIWLDDIDALVTEAQAQYPQTPIHILGHCFGAKLALGYGIGHQDKIESLCLIAPPQRALKVDIRPKEKIQVALSTLTRQHTQVKVPIADEMFTDDPKYLQFIKKDQLKLESMSTRFCLQILKMDHWLSRHLKTLQLPLLCLLAAHDDIVDVQRARSRFFEPLAMPIKKLEVYDCRHHLLFEPRRQEVLERIERWICLGD